VSVFLYWPGNNRVPKSSPFESPQPDKQRNADWHAMRAGYKGTLVHFSAHFQDGIWLLTSWPYGILRILASIQEMPVFIYYDYFSFASISSLSAPVNHPLYHLANSIWVFPFFFWISFKKFHNNHCLIHSNPRVKPVQSLLLILSRSMCNHRRGFGWWIYLLTTYTHDL
jgi:hypothetical protein